MALQAGRSEMTAFFNDGRYAGNEKESSKGDHRALCAAMVFSRMADMRVYAMEDGAGQEAQMQERNILWISVVKGMEGK